MTTKSDYKEDLEKVTAVFDTNLGTFEGELFAKECPETVWNFINLAEGRQKSEKAGNFYDGLIFHRVIDGFMIQGGCPQGTGTGGPGYNIADEFHPDLKHDSVGILSMANAGPNTGGSQFFITLDETPWLDNRHAVFGRVIDGLEVVQTIGSVQTDAGDRPLEEITINTLIIAGE